MKKTTLFLDIDGVVNAVSEGYPKQNTGWTEWATAYVSFQENPSGVTALHGAGEPKRGFRITYSPQLLRRLEALAARPDVEIVWLTTWCNDARTHLCPALGFDGTAWDVLGQESFLDRHSGSDWWKFYTLRELWELGSRDDQKFVWMDDDLKYERHALRWLESLPAGTSLAISPNTLHGLSVKHLEQVEAFIDG